MINKVKSKLNKWTTIDTKLTISSVNKLFYSFIGFTFIVEYCLLSIISSPSFKYPATIYIAALMVILVYPLLYLFTFNPLIKVIKDQEKGAEIVNKHIQEIVESKERLEKALHCENAFISNMSHEIRTPMNGVIGYTQLLEETNLDSEQKMLVDQVQVSGRHLLGIINNILDISKLRAGQVELHPENFKLDNLLKDLESLIHPLILEKGIIHVFDIAKEVPLYLYGDALRLQQILVNLVSNAVKFTPQSGAIVLRIALKEKFNNKAILEVSVADTGIGIPLDKQELIFKPFTQADNTITKKYGGTGLGLAISKTLVNLLGGEIKVRSKSGIGTVFYFDMNLIVRDIKSNLVETTTKYNKTNSAPLNILLAEDIASSQLLTKRLLEKEGHSLIVAKDGEEVLNMYKSFNFDLILMDMQMPKLSGLGATFKIRAIESLTGKPKTPIVALTAYALPEERSRFMEAGVDGHVNKPVDKKELLRVISEVSAIKKE